MSAFTAWIPSRNDLDPTRMTSQANYGEKPQGMILIDESEPLQGPSRNFLDSNVFIFLPSFFTSILHLKAFSAFFEITYHFK